MRIHISAYVMLTGFPVVPHVEASLFARPEGGLGSGSLWGFKQPNVGTICRFVGPNVGIICILGSLGFILA